MDCFSARQGKALMNLQEFTDGPGSTPAETAFRGDTESFNVFRGGTDSLLCAGNAIAEVYQSQVELSGLRQLQMSGGCEIRIVLAALGNRHMQPVEWAFQVGDEAARDIHQQLHVPGLNKMLVSRVTVAEVISELDLMGYPGAEAFQSNGDLGRRVFHECWETALQHTKLDGGVPLYRELVRGIAARMVSSSRIIAAS